MLDQVILDFVAQQKQRMATNGIVICGSYAQGRYGPDSDIDIIFLTVSDCKVEVQHVIYYDILFHRLVTSAQRLYQFLVESTEDPFAIAVLHSLTAEVIIMEDSTMLREVIRQAKKLVSERGIGFDPQDRHAIILQNRRYSIAKEDDCWKLVPVNTDDFS